LGNNFLSLAEVQVIGTNLKSKGDKGNTGDTGPRGLQGIKGDAGAQGIQGVAGINGKMALKGNRVQMDKMAQTDKTVLVATHSLLKWVAMLAYKGKITYL